MSVVEPAPLPWHGALVHVLVAQQPAGGKRLQIRILGGPLKSTAGWTARSRRDSFAQGLQEAC